MRGTLIVLTLLLTLTPVSSGQPITVSPSKVLGLVHQVKPKAKDLRWREIPWAENLEQARKMAIKENRPLFMWGSDDDPLDRC